MPKAKKREKGQEAIPRRSVLVRMVKVVSFCSFGALLLPVERFLSFKIPRRPKLVKVDKPLKKGGFIIEPDFIIFDTDSKPIAVSRKCTHLGCTLNYHELEKMLICPCHQSRFAKDGTRLAGPAKENLSTYKVEKAGSDRKGYVVTV